MEARQLKPALRNQPTTRQAGRPYQDRLELPYPQVGLVICEIHDEKCPRGKRPSTYQSDPKKNATPQPRIATPEAC